MSCPTIGTVPARVGITIAQGEVISATLTFPTSFGDLSAATVESTATITHADDTTTTLDLLPTLGGTGSRVVSFDILTATTAAATHGQGTWDLFLTESGGDPIRYVVGPFILDESDTK